MSYPDLQDRIGEACVEGISVVPSFLSQREAQRIADFYTPDHTETEVGYTSFTLSDTPLEPIADYFESQMHLAGFKTWRNTNNHVRKTILGTELHRDFADLRDVSFILYTSGVTCFDYGKSKDRLSSSLILQSGDAVLLRGKIDSVTDLEAIDASTDDERLWHKASNLDGTRYRSFAHIGYQSYGDIAYDVQSRRPMYVD